MLDFRLKLSKLCLRLRLRRLPFCSGLSLPGVCGELCPETIVWGRQGHGFVALLPCCLPLMREEWYQQPNNKSTSS